MYDSDKIFYVTLGKNIKDRRKALGFSQMELARHIGVSYQQLQKYESGKNRITPYYLCKAAAFLQIKTCELVDESHC